ncbi:MAG: YraN family protein [Synechococcus sp. Tobar2m-G35]|jgi:putative endonuclease|nr:YraN family protein [Synechococcus sp. Tobar2m-G35]
MGDRRAMAGRGAEALALTLLQQRGWMLLARNWRCRWGELDLLLTKPGRLLLVEVKGRRSAGRDLWGSRRLGQGQALRLRRAFACWLADHPGQALLPVEVVLALVPLPPATGGVRWLHLDEL